MRYKPFIAIPYVGLWQLSFYLDLNRWLILVASLFPLMFLKSGDLRADRKVVISLFLSILMIFILIEPGLAYGKLVFNGLSSPLPQIILYSLLSAISLVFVTESIIVKSLYKKPFYAISLSAIVYVFSIFPLRLLLDLNSLPDLLLFNISFFVIIAFFLGFLYLKCNLNALPSMAFLAVYTSFTYIGVSVLVSKLFNVVWEVISISVILFLADFAIKEPMRIRRIFKQRPHKVESRSILPTLFAGVGVLFTILVALPLVTHESHYVIADPTGSMYPIIKPDSLLFISYIKISSITKGTIIVFHAPWSNGALFAHQVVGIQYKGNTEYFITKGVANANKDPLPVPSSDVVGKVALAIPYLGYLLIYGEFFVILILSIVAVLFLLEMRK